MFEHFPIVSHWAWMILAAVLGTAEIIMPGFFLIWIGLAALLTGILTLILGISEPIQFTIFAVFSIVAVYAGRRWFLLNPIATTDPLLNDRGARLVGESVIVVEAIEGGSGRVRVGDGVWNAKGADAAIGTRLRVTGVDKGALLVEAQ